MKDKVLIDTSVWIDYFKGGNSQLIDKVEVFIKDEAVYVPKVVIAELIQGAKSKKETKIIEELTDAFSIIDQGEETWKRVGVLSHRLKRKGKTCNLIDCYIAIIAKENGCKVFTLDPHFQKIKKEAGIELISL
jgi:hypothetical protein